MKKTIFLFTFIAFNLMLVSSCKKDSSTTTQSTTPTVANGTLTDSRDNKTYKVVKVGTQVWMAENLNYTTSTGSWCYNNDVNNCAVYGRLYDWPTAMQGASSSNSSPSGVKGICPDGWHLPSDAEWLILASYLGGDSIAGAKMKETGTAHWVAPNSGADNSSKMTVLGSGFRTPDEVFTWLTYGANFWSSSELSSQNAYQRYIRYDAPNYLNKSAVSKTYGLSVRCVKD
ncbi:MAG: fibrobacter succinogenes major paralogous domain-containing protein [Bacteroidota bacterium]|nr:fibrobacter succinogenes major paralogous domain-containing protein [Bacteroidota bacterium]